MNSLPKTFFSSMVQQPLVCQGLLLTLHDHTQTHNTVGRTPLDELSARRRDIYLTTHNTHKRQTSIPPAGFEPTIPASELPQTARPLGSACSKYYCFTVQGPTTIGTSVAHARWATVTSVCVFMLSFCHTALLHNQPQLPHVYSYTTTLY
jgi:hypothetical protein